MVNGDVLKVAVADDAVRSRGIAQGPAFRKGDQVAVECQREGGRILARTVRSPLTVARFTVASVNGSHVHTTSGHDVDVSGLWRGGDPSLLAAGRRVEALLWADPVSGHLHLGKVSLVF